MTRVHPRGALPHSGSSKLLGFLALLVASLATAALAHVCIDLVGALGSGDDAYEDHAHGAVAPVGLGALALVVTLLFWCTALRIGRSQAIDPALLLARRFGRTPPLVPSAAVAAGGFLTLLAMEFTEQLSGLGRVEGVADALGGNACVGLAIVACAAATVTSIGLRSASAILQATVATIGAVYAWIVVRAHTLVIDAAILRRAQRPRRHGVTNAFLARSRGLRAPPVRIV